MYFHEFQKIFGFSVSKKIWPNSGEIAHKYLKKRKPTVRKAQLKSFFFLFFVFLNSVIFCQNSILKMSGKMSVFLSRPAWAGTTEDWFAWLNFSGCHTDGAGCFICVYDNTYKTTLRAVVTGCALRGSLRGMCSFVWEEVCLSTFAALSTKLYHCVFSETN